MRAPVRPGESPPTSAAPKAPAVTESDATGDFRGGRADDVEVPLSQPLMGTSGPEGDHQGGVEEEDETLSAAVDMVLEMTASFDEDGFQRPPSVSRAEVSLALQTANGDVSLAMDEVLSLAAIRSLRLQERDARTEEQERQSRLQLHELCEGLGLGECNAFVRAVEALSEREKQDVLSTNGGFIQQLLLAMDEEDADSLDSLGNQEEEGAEEHPLAQLIAMYPNYRVEVIEDVLEQQNYDVQAAADALHNLRALDHVQSFASVVAASGKAAAAQQDLLEHGPHVESLGQFPALSSKTQQKKLKRAQRQRTQQRNQQHHVVATAEAARRKYRVHAKAANVNHWDASRHQKASDTSSSGRTISIDGTGSSGAVARIESGLASQLKIDRLHRILPSVDRNVIQTTFFLNGGSSDATEASLREIFNLPLADHTALPPSTADVPNDQLEEEATSVSAVLAASMRPRASPREQWSTVSHRRRVDDTRKELSDRYCEMLESFRRDHHAMASDRVRKLSKARQDLRDAQRQLAHDFFTAHQEQIKHQQPLDLHGLIVMEALQVVRETIEFCQHHRIRRCLFICGQGHHSVNGRPRILTALRLSLERRQIDHRELHGIVTVFPLRSPNAV